LVRANEKGSGFWIIPCKEIVEKAGGTFGRKSGRKESAFQIHVTFDNQLVNPAKIAIAQLIGFISKFWV